MTYILMDDNLSGLFGRKKNKRKKVKIRIFKKGFLKKAFKKIGPVIKKVFKGVGSVVKKALPAVANVAGGLIGGPVGAGITSALTSRKNKKSIDFIGAVRDKVLKSNPEKAKSLVKVVNSYTKISNATKEVKKIGALINTNKIAEDLGKSLINKQIKKINDSINIVKKEDIKSDMSKQVKEDLKKDLEESLIPLI